MDKLKSACTFARINIINLVGLFLILQADSTLFEGFWKN